MATSGEHGRFRVTRNRRAGAAGCAFLLAVLAAGAASGTIGCGGPRPAGDAGAAAPTSVPSAAPAHGFCPQALPAAWRSALGTRRVGQRSGETVVVHAVTPDGGTAVADVRGPAGRQVAWIAGGTRRTVLPLSRPDTDQVLGAATDGRYVAFSVGHDPSNPDDWTLYGWDSSATAPPHQLDHGRTDPSGRPVAGPLPLPVVGRGVVAWTVGLPDGTAQLHRVTLATGSDQLVRAGHPANPFLLGPLLVWPESPAPGRPTELRAVSAADGTPAALPAVPAAVRGPAFIAAGPDTLAWSSSDTRTLWVWHTGWPAAVSVVAAPAGRALQWIRVAGPLLAFDDGTAQFAADLRTGGFAQLTKQYGYTEANGDGLVVGYPPAGKSSPADAPSLLRVSSLPALPRCR